MSAQVEEVPEEKSGTTSTGIMVKLRLRPKTKWMRDSAYEKASIAFREMYGRAGVSAIAFGEEWNKQRIISWTATDASGKLVPMKKHVSNGGWRDLPDEVGDLIEELTGTEAAMQSVMSRLTKGGNTLSEEAEKAKNSASASSMNRTPISDSSSPLTSGEPSGQAP